MTRHVPKDGPYKGEQSCLAVMYHYVRDSSTTAFPAIRALAPDLFTRQLDWLQEHHEIVGVEDLRNALDGRRALPPRAATLTFDDGFIDHFTTVFPLIRERGLSGVFFVAHDACAPCTRRTSCSRIWVPRRSHTPCFRSAAWPQMWRDAVGRCLETTNGTRR